jgi:1,2-phenylacetyl-CoA epoxidase PaaB subunit
MKNNPRPFIAVSLFVIAIATLSCAKEDHRPTLERIVRAMSEQEYHVLKNMAVGDFAEDTYSEMMWNGYIGEFSQVYRASRSVFPEWEVLAEEKKGRHIHSELRLRAGDEEFFWDVTLTFSDGQWLISEIGMRQD